MRSQTKTKDRLLQVATLAFAQEGFDGMTVDKIVAKARCNKRMVYYYFGNKEKLYHAVLERVYEQFAEFEQCSIQKSEASSAQALLKEVVSDYLDFLETHPHVVALLAWENLNQGRAIKHLRVQETKRPLLDRLTKIFRQEDPTKTSREIDQIFISLIALCYFAYSNRYTMKQVLGFDPVGRNQKKIRYRHILTLLNQGVH